MRNKLLIVLLICTVVPVAGRTRLARIVPVAHDSAACDTSVASLSVMKLDSLLVGNAPAQELQQPAEVPIMGDAEVDVETMCRFVSKRNADFDCAIAQAFHDVGKRYGIRGDIALCQSILETGWFKYVGGTAVRPEQHNYCGLGVTRLGLAGASFETIEEGVTAQIQHLYAYATRSALPKGEVEIDPRFRMVVRGSAPTWQKLNMRWAMNNHYADRILNLYAQMREMVK